MPVDWELRVGKVSASMVPQILGVSRWGGPVSAWRQATGKEERTPPEGDAAFGIFMERAVLEWYGSVHAVDTLKEGATIVSPEYPWLCASPDGFAEWATDTPEDPPRKRAVEVKCPRYTDRWGAPGTDEVPTEYYLQCQTQGICTGLDVDLPMLAYRSLVTYHVPKNEEVRTAIIDTCYDFWDRYIRTDSPPPADGTEASKHMLYDAYPKARADRKVHAADAREAGLIVEYKHAKARYEAAETEHAKAKQAVMEAIADRYGIEYGNNRAIWYGVKPSVRADWKAYALALGGNTEGVRDHVKTTKARRDFRFIERTT